MHDKMKVKRAGMALGAAAAIAVSVVIGHMPAMAQSTAPAVPLDEETWKRLTVGQTEAVVVFAVNVDGEVQAYIKESMPEDPDDYPQTTLKHRSIGLTIGGNTRVCWTTSGGDEQCSPPG